MNYLVSFFLLTVFFFANTQATVEGIEKYLVPIVNKTEGHSIRNIDFIYMINLDKRPEKFIKSCNQLNPFGIYPFRFPAVNGWTLPIDTINGLGVKYEAWMNFPNTVNHYHHDGIGVSVHELNFIFESGPMHREGEAYFISGLSLGGIGCVLSHVSVLQDAYNSGYKTIWIMEDDIEVLRDPNMVSDLVIELDETVGKKNWDILFTDQDTKNNAGTNVACYSFHPRPNFSPSDPERFAQRSVHGRFKKIGARYGSYSMIIKRSGIKKLLNYFKKYQVFLPYDLEYNMPDDIKLYTVIDDVVSTLPNAPTDNSAPFYKSKNN